MSERDALAMDIRLLVLWQFVSHRWPDPALRHHVDRLLDYYVGDLLDGPRGSYPRERSPRFGSTTERLVLPGQSDAK